MKFYYPKFLRINPKFIGLSLFDLSLLLSTLFVASVLRFNAFTTLALIVVAIGISKIVSLKYPRGYFQFYHLKRSVLDWRQDLLRLTQGVFI